MILLDSGVFVIDMEGRNHSLRNDSGAEEAGRRLAHPPVKDQLHLTGPADIQIFTDHFLEEHATGHGPVQNLGQRELRLQDGNLVAITSLAIPGLVRMRQ